MAHRGRRTADDALAVALAAGRTVRDAATAAGVGERTATRRTADPAFQRRVVALRGEMVKAALGRMTDGMTEAADTLRALLHATSESVRLGAARALVELACKLRESADLAERVEVLEQRINHAGPLA
ncbi:MAG TPA: hypothetical protein VGF55_19445 [Gemmataceae bacterium]